MVRPVFHYQDGNSKAVYPLVYRGATLRQTTLEQTG